MRQPWGKLQSWWQARTRGAGDGSACEEAPSLQELVRQAQREVEAARAYFESVSDPDLVDHACYLLEAAQRRYSYVLKLARQRTVS